MGEIAAFTINPPARANRGTSSHPPAKSTRSGATCGARIQRTISVVEMGGNSGGVFAITTYFAPTSAHNARFKSAHLSSSVTAKMSGRSRKKCSLKSMPSSSPCPTTTSSTIFKPAISARLCSSGNELFRCL